MSDLSDEDANAQRKGRDESCRLAQHRQVEEGADEADTRFVNDRIVPLEVVEGAVVASKARTYSAFR